MKDDRLYARLGKEDKVRLVELSAPYGGIGGWILAQVKGIVPTVQVGRPIDCLGCAELREVVEVKDVELVSLRSKLVVAPTGSCKGCADRDTTNLILKARLVMVEKELTLMKRDRKVLDAVGGDGCKASPYRLGPGK